MKASRRRSLFLTLLFLVVPGASRESAVTAGAKSEKASQERNDTNGKDFRHAEETVYRRCGARRLCFPVARKDCRHITSSFGTPRDCGVRRHQGIDIPAKSATAVVAVDDCEVLRWDSSARGGRELWLRDTVCGRMYYYAHLRRRMAKKGQRVRKGDTIALLGSSGFTKGCSHLHFGIYTDRFIDPAPFFPETLSGFCSEPESGTKTSGLRSGNRNSGMQGKGREADRE